MYILKCNVNFKVCAMNSKDMLSITNGLAVRKLIRFVVSKIYLSLNKQLDMYYVNMKNRPKNSITITSTCKLYLSVVLD